jgi:asparagine synthase (glutamine-hydrolysing)
MSGFVATFKDVNRHRIEDMFKKIHHRGPFLFGKFECKDALLAQNYLEGDLNFDARDDSGLFDIQVPVFDPEVPEYRICLDAQMGNWKKRAKSLKVPDGPFREERLFLKLFQKHGKRMFKYLDDAIFSFIITNGQKFFAARDLLGIKTMFYGKKNGVLYLASELKSLKAVTDEIHEFPPGHFMDDKGEFVQFADLPKEAPSASAFDPEEMADKIRDIIQRSLRSRIDFNVPTASLLSGGVDSSVIAFLADEAYRKKFGTGSRLKTFALGVGESQDIRNARLMSEHIQSDHYELIVDLDRMLTVLPQVIYYLESFDPSLVRSSVSNFLITEYAKEKGIQAILSGEGGDEVFCGYEHLKNTPEEELFTKQMECIGFLHNNASLRLDRMNHCHSIRVVAPLISGELLNYAMAIPSEYKIRSANGQKIEKWIFRKAFEKDLPKEIAWRVKQEFSQGSGSSDILPAYFENEIPNKELKAAQSQYPFIRSKEELHYFRLFSSHFGSGPAVETVGQWIRL